MTEYYLVYIYRGVSIEVEAGPFDTMDEVDEALHAFLADHHPDDDNPRLLTITEDGPEFHGWANGYIDGIVQEMRPELQP